MIKFIDIDKEIVDPSFGAEGTDEVVTRVRFAVYRSILFLFQTSNSGCRFQHNRSGGFTTTSHESYGASSES